MVASTENEIRIQDELSRMAFIAPVILRNEYLCLGIMFINVNLIICIRVVTFKFILLLPLDNNNNKNRIVNRRAAKKGKNANEGNCHRGCMAGRCACWWYLGMACDISRYPDKE